jgi:hypothetical protein
MADRLEVAPDDLRRAARDHRETAERLRAVPGDHPEIMATLESLGPVFAELREAGRNLLEARRKSYEQQASAHNHLADSLSAAADAWEAHEADAAGAFRAAGGEPA